MQRSIRAAAVMAALFLVLPVAVAQARTPMFVAFDVQTTFQSPGAIGTFVATGTAVDNGLVCGLGTTLDVSYTVTGSGANRINRVLKSFTCDNGSGTLLLKLQVNASNTYSWTIAGGTGNYVRLQGSGTGYGVAPPPGSSYDIHDFLFGSVHS